MEFQDQNSSTTKQKSFSCHRTTMLCPKRYGSWRAKRTDSQKFCATFAGEFWGEHIGVLLEGLK
jgi:hypothetical protein